MEEGSGRTRLGPAGAAIGRRSVLAGLAAGAVCAAPWPGARAGARAGGLFIPGARIEALRRGAPTPDLQAFLTRIAPLRAHGPAPFAADPDTLRFGWKERQAPPDDTLREATTRLQADSDAARDLALGFALTGDPAQARAALRVMLAWARRGRAVNLYDYDPDFAAASMRGGTEGFGSDRPWNFGLDMIWQGYGLLNACDAFLLLRHGGAAIAPAEAEELRAWFRRLAEATNSGLHAWTLWAEAHAPGAGRTGAPHFHGGFGGDDPMAAAVERHLADNHLSWAMAGLLAAAAALEDPALAAHVLTGAPWTDRRAGRRRNPAPLPGVILRAVEPDGRVYEERIGRRTPIGYGLFHLEAWCLCARIAARQGWADLWSGDVGAAILAAALRYAPYMRGDKASPAPAEAQVRARWLLAASPPGFGGARRAGLLAAAPPPPRMTHAIGPAALLLGG